MRWSDFFHWTKEERRALLAIVLFTGGGGLLVELGRRFPAWTPDLKLLSAAVADTATGQGPGGSTDSSAVPSASPEAPDSLGLRILAGLGGAGSPDRNEVRPADAPPGSRSDRGKRESRPTGPIDLNRADAATLALLPGIGPKMAERILEDRRTNGAYRTVKDLDRVKGVGPALLQKIAGLAVVGASSDSL